MHMYRNKSPQLNSTEQAFQASLHTKAVDQLGAGIDLENSMGREDPAARPPPPSRRRCPPCASAIGGEAQIAVLRSMVARGQGDATQRGRRCRWRGKVRASRWGHQRCAWRGSRSPTTDPICRGSAMASPCGLLHSEWGPGEWQSNSKEDTPNY